MYAFECELGEGVVRRLQMETFSRQARDWWGQWNRGHPVAELLSHFPHPDVSRNSYMLLFDELKKPLIPTAEAAVQILSRFIMELSAGIDEEVMDGNWKLGFAHAGSTGPHATALPRLAFLPTHEEDKEGSLISNRAKQLRHGWNLIRKHCDAKLSAMPTNLGSQESIVFTKSVAEWLTSSIAPLVLPGEDDEIGSVALVENSRKVGMIGYFPEEVETTKQILYLRGYKGITLAGKAEMSVLSASPIFTCRLSKSVDDLATSTWSSLLANLMHVHHEPLVHHLKLSFLAEKLQQYGDCIPIEKVESDSIKHPPGLIPYRFLRDEPHPVWGEFNRPSASEFIDHMFEHGLTEVAINERPDPMNWNEKFSFEVISTTRTDPNIVLVRAKNDEMRIPTKGWLRPINIGTKILNQRKQHILNHSIRSSHLRETLTSSSSRINKIRRLTRDNEQGKDGWRIDCRGPLQLIQGPPGTGKTWTATRLVEDILTLNPASRILVCAKEHLALNHLTSSLVESMSSFNDGEHSVIRLVGSKRQKEQLDKQGLHQYLPPFQGKESWNQIFDEVKDDLDSDQIKFFSEHLESRQGVSHGWFSSSAVEEASVICVSTTDRELLEILRMKSPTCFDYCIVEEAGKSYPTELIGPMSISRNWILIGDQMQLPPFQLREISENLEHIIAFNKRNHNRKEIRDAVAEEVYELRKNGAWRRAYQDSELHDEVMGYLQPFKSMYAEAQKREQGTHYLSQQRRMFIDLSDIVGSVYYSGPFDWRKENEVDIESTSSIFSEHGRLILIDTPHCSVNSDWMEKRTQIGSIGNRLESKLVAGLAKQLHEKDMEVVCLTPYNGQVKYISDELDCEGEVRVHTTDGFQGKEADFIILSLVRNNNSTGGRRWGFVSDPNRMNVALSRAREGLILITSGRQVDDTDFLEEQEHLREAIEFFRQKGKVLTMKDLEVLEVDQ